MRRSAVLVLLLALVAAGCIRPEPISMAQPHMDPILVDDEGLLDGVLDKEWVWNVEPGYATFRVCVMFEGAGTDAPFVVLPRVQLRRDHTDGFEVTGRSELAALSAPGCWFDLDGGDPGTWTLSLNAEGGRARWIVQVDVVY